MLRLRGEPHLGCQAPLIWQPSPPRGHATGSVCRSASGDFAGPDASPNDGAQPNAGYHLPLPAFYGTPFFMLDAASPALSFTSAEYQDLYHILTTVFEDSAASVAGPAYTVPAILHDPDFCLLVETFALDCVYGFGFDSSRAYLLELAFSSDTPAHHTTALDSAYCSRSLPYHARRRLPAAHPPRPYDARGLPRV